MVHPRGRVHFDLPPTQLSGRQSIPSKLSNPVPVCVTYRAASPTRLACTQMEDRVVPEGLTGVRHLRVCGTNHPVYGADHFIEIVESAAHDPGRRASRKGAPVMGGHTYAAILARLAARMRMRKKPRGVRVRTDPGGGSLYC